MNNIKYSLVETERPKQLVKELKLSLDQKDAFLSTANCSKEETDELKISIRYIETQLLNDNIDQDYLFNRWHEATNLDALSYNEALCMLLGIPIDLASKFIHIDLSKEDVELKLAECSVEYEFYNTNENDYLKRRYFHNSIDTKKFIRWAIEKNFIQYLEKNTEKHGLNNYNNHRSWAKQKNTETVLQALESYTGKLTPSALLGSETTKFYTKLKSSLVELELVGNKKPLPKTLINYVSQHNNKK